jgi:hypothetical protein
MKRHIFICFVGLFAVLQLIIFIPHVFAGVDPIGDPYPNGTPVPNPTLTPIPLPTKAPCNGGGVNTCCTATTQCQSGCSNFESNPGSGTCHGGYCNCTSTTATGCGGWEDVGGGYSVRFCDNNRYQIGFIPPSPPPGGPAEPTLPPGVSPTLPPLGTVTLVAKIMPGNPTCSDLAASAQYLAGTQMTVNASTKTQDGAGTPSSWTLIAASFPVTVSPPANYIPTLVCWTYDTIVPPPTFLANHNLTAQIVDGQVLKGYIGLTLGGGAWTQTAGGNTYAANTTASRIPVTAPQAYFSANGSGGKPGLLTFGSSFDVSLNPTTNGAEAGSNSLSSTRWNMQTTYPQQSLYDHFTLLLGGMVGSGDAWDADGDLSEADFAGCAEPTHCYFTGNPTINSAITIGAAEKRILVINGTLTIKNTITIAPGGFLAIIAKDGIIVDPSVGAGAPAVYSVGITPQIQGMYITGGDFSIPASVTPPDKQLVLKGMFIVDNFSIARSMSNANNLLYPATMFIHDPSLLFSTPLIMQEVPFRWQEVAP